MEIITVPTTMNAVVLRLGLAVLFGAVIGFNRELHRKRAGLQTHSLVALGAALMSLTSLQLVSSIGDTSAVSRVIQGLVAGVGFIGGGVILHRDDSKGVYGLTTAASIWVVAAMGTTVGLGLWRTALAAVGLSLGILIVGRAIDRLLQSHRDGKETRSSGPGQADTENSP